MKIVLDTNTLISAMIANGKPRKLLIRGIGGEFIIVTSKGMLDELKDVINRPKFKLSKSEIDKLGSTIRDTTRIVDIKSNFKVVKEDPDDDLIINTAYGGKANYIVSGDTHLLNLKEFRGIKIVTVNEMLNILK